MPGSLFVPATADGQHFISGRLNDFPVLVSLDGDDPVKLAAPEAWTPRAGLNVKKIRFEVDKASATEIRRPQEASPGALILSRHGAMIAARDDNGLKAVLLEGGTGSTQIDDIGAIAFTSWQIVAANEAGVIMFRSPAVPN